MRIKDELKQEAIIKATVKLVNEIGFVYSSVAKIAKEADVSPATIYIYYKNKEDLLVSTYLEIKKELSEAILAGVDETQPLRDTLYHLWHNGFVYIRKNPEYFRYAEQFSSSPYADLVDPKSIEQYMGRFSRIIQKGIDQKILKNVSFDLLMAFMYFPIVTLSNPKLCKSFDLTEANIEQAFTMAWDAIKY